MPITVSCRCGKDYRVADQNAGKRLKCKECGTTLKIPGEQLDDLEDYDDEDEEEVKVPVRRATKKKRSRSGGVDTAKVVNIVGIISGIVGLIFCAIYVITGIGWIVMGIAIMSAAHGPNVASAIARRVILTWGIAIALFFASRSAIDWNRHFSDNQSRLTWRIIAICFCHVPWILTLISYLTSDPNRAIILH